MEKITTTTVYLEVPVSEMVAKCGKQLSIPLISTSGMVTQQFVFDCKNMGHEKYKALEKKEEMVCISKEEFNNIISNAITDGADEYIKKEQYPSGKFVNKYIDSLFNKP